MKTSDETEGTEWPHERPYGWHPRCDDGFEGIDAGIDPYVIHDLKPCAYLKRTRSDFRSLAILLNSFMVGRFQGTRLKMTLSLKSKLTSGTAQAWVRIDGDWEPFNYPPIPGLFDNMDDRPIEGEQDWTEHDLVVDVPSTSTHVVYGVFLTGTGQVWLGSPDFEIVNTDVVLTGPYCSVKK